MQPCQCNNHCSVGKSNALWEMSWATRPGNKDESELMIVIKRSKANSRTQRKFAKGYNRKTMENFGKAFSCWAIPAGQTLSRSKQRARASLFLVFAPWPGANSTHVPVRTAAAVHVPGDPASLSISVRVHCAPHVGVILGMQMVQKQTILDHP